MLGVSDIDVSIAIAIIIGFVVVLYSYCIYLLRTGVGIRS
jgi:ABC-2 type transport system permease protein